MLFTEAIKQELLSKINNRIEDAYEEILKKVSDQYVANSSLQAQIDSLRDEIMSKINTFNDTLKDVRDENEFLKKEREELEAYRNRKNNGPYAELISNEVDEHGKLKIVFDWNKEFIQNLIAVGFRGKNDEEIMTQWLNSVLYSFAGEIPVQDK